MRYPTKVCMLILMLSTLTEAKEDGYGWYIGLGVGATAYEDSGFVKNEQPSVQDEVTKNSSGYKVYAGYQINKIIATEISYTGYGTFSSSSYAHSAYAGSASANVGYTFLEGMLRPYGLLGLSYVNNNFPHDEVDIKPNAFSVHSGIGLDYTPNFTAGFGLRVAFEGDTYSYTVKDTATDEKTKYDQSLGILYLGIHYKY